MSGELLYYEEEFLENKFFEYKADFAAKGLTEEEAEIAAAEALDKLMEMYGWWDWLLLVSLT